MSGSLGKWRMKVVYFVKLSKKYFESNLWKPQLYTMQRSIYCGESHLNGYIGSIATASYAQRTLLKEWENCESWNAALLKDVCLSKAWTMAISVDMLIRKRGKISQGHTFRLKSTGSYWVLRTRFSQWWALIVFPIQSGELWNHIHTSNKYELSKLYFYSVR